MHLKDERKEKRKAIERINKMKYRTNGSIKCMDGISVDECLINIFQKTLFPEKYWKNITSKVIEIQIQMFFVSISFILLFDENKKIR